MAGRRALLGVDVGGTFTDGVLVVGGRAYFAKAPSRPGREEEAIEAVIDRLLAAAGASGRCIARFAHGMTVTTNALLEGRTAKAAFLATAGFTDVVDLGRQARPSLYRLCDQPPRALVPPALRFAVRERSPPRGWRWRRRRRSLPSWRSGLPPPNRRPLPLRSSTPTPTRSTSGLSPGRCAAACRGCRSPFPASWLAPFGSTNGGRQRSLTPPFRRSLTPT